ncbi:MAG: hypothetical protein M5U10_10915 [Candidatus Methanoperedens sp.]|uniref:hypothetical protein n=1 Tax=Candidatus Methanoperedens nitratireducens TaxID=1392998 RepID=UPI0012FEEA0E|nr:hypothetical protein [Candidatus Methanoperedens nitroreducens]MDJ1422414.1 hypothetical protein [Candidatus Methanoperedens sp.]
MEAPLSAGAAYRLHVSTHHVTTARRLAAEERGRTSCRTMRPCSRRRRNEDFFLLVNWSKKPKETGEHKIKPSGDREMSDI